MNAGFEFQWWMLLFVIDEITIVSICVLKFLSTRIPVLNKAFTWVFEKIDTFIHHFFKK